MKIAFTSIGLPALICVLLLDVSTAVPLAEGHRTQRDVPAPGCSSWWLIREGTTCWEAAQICGVDLPTLYHYNGLLQDGRACDNLQIGNIICCGYGG